MRTLDPALGARDELRAPLCDPERLYVSERVVERSAIAADERVAVVTFI